MVKPKSQGKAAAKAAKKAKAAQKVERKEKKKVKTSKSGIGEEDDDEDLEAILDKVRRLLKELNTNNRLLCIRSSYSESGRKPIMLQKR